MRILGLRVLRWAFSLLICFEGSLAAEQHVYLPNKNACPVTANLFPEQVRSGDTLRFVFPENAHEFPSNHATDTFKFVAQRISITLSSSDGKDVEIDFTWIGAVFAPPHMDWGAYSGSFVVKANGSPNCFFLGPEAGLPGNIPCKEFCLKVPLGVDVKEIAFSNAPSEKPLKTCPMPELEKSINQALEDCRATPQDGKKTLYALQLLEKAVPRYDCRRSYDYEPIPAWWMADYKVIDGWINFLYHKVLEEDKFALKVYVEFLNTSDGYIAEGMSWQIWGILRDHPKFIIENWDSVKEYKKSILGSVHLQPLGSEVDMISIYKAIAQENPVYKSVCEEIIGILEIKVPS